MECFLIDAVRIGLDLQRPQGVRVENKLKINGRNSRLTLRCESSFALNDFNNYVRNNERTVYS